MKYKQRVREANVHCLFVVITSVPLVRALT